MRVLMLGWEYPPQISGGLGTACFGLTEALLKDGHEVMFVIPKTIKEETTDRFQLISASNVPLPSHLDAVKFSLLNKLIEPVDLRRFRRFNGEKYKFSGAYGPNLMEEVYWLTVVTSRLAEELDFDIIHAHDWLTYLAGIMAKEISGKPLVVHMHATEFDRSNYTNWQVYEIERQGMIAADKVIAVSNLTRNIIVNKYNIASEKVITIYNGVTQNEKLAVSQPKHVKEKLVTFLGRITYQKGPEYFIAAAEKILKKNKNVRFIMAGTGDLMPRMIERVAAKRLSTRFHFPGFLQGLEVDRMLSMSDVFVMPSVSEPFGITPLEAIRSEVPVVISKQSGVAEVLPHALKVDYWDTDNLAEVIHGLLNYRTLAKTVNDLNQETLQGLTWENAAAKVTSTYLSIV